ncbi:MAG: apolipoprotein N-acyltransferase, partial [Rhodospirillaceae bacterium]
MNETCATLPTRLARSSGWRRWGWAALFGAVATLALPPVCGVPLLLIAVPGLLWLLDGVGEPRSAFALGWWFGFAYFGFGLYWISFALLTDIAQFWWLMPVAIAGLPALMAIFTGLVTMTVWSLGGRGLVRVVTFATVWVIAEWLRGHLFTGFPWQLVGYCWVDYSEVLQTAAVTGVYGLSLLTMLVAGLPALLADPSVPRRRALMALACGLTLFASLAVAGTWRLASAEVETVAGVRLRLVQANIDQGRKWADSEREGNFQRHLEMSVAPSALGKGWQPTVVIWPETAIAYFLAQDVRHRAAVAAAVPPGGLILTGAPRATLEPKVAPRATLEP